MLQIDNTEMEKGELWQHTQTGGTEEKAEKIKFLGLALVQWRTVTYPIVVISEGN